MMWGFGEGMFILFQPLYLQELGADPFLIGMIMGAIGIAMTIAHIPAGYLADTIGRRPLLFTAWTIGAIATIIMALAHSLPIFVLGSILYGATAFVIAPLNSYITAARGKFAVGRVLTLISAAYNLGSIGGPLLGGWIGQNYGLHFNFYFAAVFFIISALIIFNIKAQPIEKSIKGKNSAFTRELISSRFTQYLFIVFIVMFALYLPQPLSQNFLQNERLIPLSQMGILISARSAGVVILNLTIGHLNAALGFVLAQAAMALFTLFIWFGTGLPWYLVGYMLLGSYQTARSMTIAQARPLVKAANMGLAYGIVETINSSAAILAPPLAGFLYTQNPDTLYKTSFFLIIGVIMITLLFSPVKINPSKKFNLKENP